MITTVLFDLFGTLIELQRDSKPYHKIVRQVPSAERYELLHKSILNSCCSGSIKPDPSIYKFALEQLGSSPAETIMVGDSYKSDVLGSSDIGIRGIHLVRKGGQNKPNEIIELNGVMREAYR